MYITLHRSELVFYHEFVSASRRMNVLIEKREEEKTNRMAQGTGDRRGELDAWQAWSIWLRVFQTVKSAHVSLQSCIRNDLAMLASRWTLRGPKQELHPRVICCFFTVFGSDRIGRRSDYTRYLFIERVPFKAAPSASRKNSSKRCEPKKAALAAQWRFAPKLAVAQARSSTCDARRLRCNGQRSSALPHPGKSLR